MCKKVLNYILLEKNVLEVYGERDFSLTLLVDFTSSDPLTH